jgi:hypothetical protein
MNQKQLIKEAVKGELINLKKGFYVSKQLMHR